MSRKLVMRVSSLVDRHTSRRGFLRSLVMSATAIAFAPAYLVRPIAAEAAIITCLGLRCSSWSACCDGWTEFCCRLTGENTCPPGTVVGGWWKVNNSSFCSYDEPRPRYYIDCNVACVNAAGCRPGGLCRRSETAAQCRCPDGCDTRKVDCVQFRYGQCNQQTCVGPIRCRVVTCVPPWQWDPTCSRRPALTSEATRHHDRPCLHDWFNDVPPNAFYAGAVRWMSDRGIATGVTDDLFGPEDPIRWEDFATWLWSYATGRTTEPPSPLEEANPRTDYEKALDWMALNEVVPGPAAQDLDPSKTVTRAEAITFLHRLAAVTNAASREEPTPKDLYPERELITERPPFPDVADGAWYGEAVDWAATHGIIWWSPPDPFHPDQVVTRSEAAVYLHRFHEPPTPPPAPQPEHAQPSTDAVSGGYSDVGSSTHEEAIAALGAQGVFEATECGPGEFCPRDAVERWVMAVWLVRVLDGADPDPVSASRFVDVDPTQWWAPYVERLADLGVTRGCATGPARFCPHETVTRAGMASLLVRAFDLPDASSAGFADVPAGAHTANINALASSGITVGCDTAALRYCPGRDVTRAQMATFLVRAENRRPPEPTRTSPSGGSTSRR